MRLPWMSRCSHDEMISLLRSQLAYLSEERRLLLDRLAAIGLGGPIYSATADETGDDGPTPEEISDPEKEFLEQMMRLRHRPARLADTLTQRAYRQYGKRGTGPKIAWVPQMEKVNAALDEAEARGRASSGIGDQRSGISS